MKKFVMAALVAAAAVAPYSPASAGPPAPGPGGLLCGFISTTDPGTEDGSVQTGEMDGGPVFGTGTLTCTIQVGAELHSGPNAVSVSGSGTVVTVVPPTVISYNSPPNVAVYLCVSWTDQNGTVYFHEDPADPTNGHWTADPNKPCSLAISAEA